MNKKLFPFFLILFNLLFVCSNDEISNTNKTDTENFTFEINGQEFGYEIRDGYILIQGDIIIAKEGDSEETIRKAIEEYYYPSPGSKTVIPYENKHWTNGLVYYAFNANYPADERDEVEQAMAWWTNEVPGLHFIQRSNQSNFISFRQVDGTVSSSYIGMISGLQEILIGDDISVYSVTGVTAHELGHALGFDHIQCRSDRDTYVTVHYENIVANENHNFAMYAEGSGWDYGTNVNHKDFSTPCFK